MENLGPVVLIVGAVIITVLLGIGYYMYRNRERTGVVNEVSRPKNGEDRTLYEILLNNGNRCYIAVFGKGPEDIRKGKSIKFKANWAYPIYTKYPAGFVRGQDGAMREDTVYIYYHGITEYSVLSDFD